MEHRTHLLAKVAAGLVAVIGLAGLLGACAPGASQASANPPAVPTATPPATFAAGTALGGKPATPFTLTDQYGHTVSLASLKGHPIFLTFMDATCTQECPITAQWVDWTANFLGAKDAAQVRWIVISVNPSNTPAEVHDFMTKNKVTANLDFLMGTKAQLAPVWKGYGVTVIPPTTPGGDVGHSVANFLIDGNGHLAEYLTDGFDPKNAAHDLKLLLAQG